MFKIPPRIIKKLEEQYKPESIKKYTFALKKVLKEVYESDKYDINKFKGTVKQVEEYLKTDIPEKQRHSFSFIIYKFLTLEPNKIKKRDLEKYKDLNYRMKIAYNPADKNSDDLQNKEEITLKELLDIRSKYDLMSNEKENIKKSSVQLGRLLLYFYTEIPPLRSQDLINTVYGKKTNDAGDNFLDLDKGVLHVISGKTKNSIRDVKLTDTLIKIAKQTKERIASDYVIPRLKNYKEKMTASNFTHFLNSVIGKKISSSKLRNIMASKYLDEGLNSEERAKIAKDMGHSFTTHSQIYTKYSRVLHKSREIMEENNKLKEEIKKLKEEIKNLKRQ